MDGRAVLGVKIIKFIFLNQFPEGGFLLSGRELIGFGFG
jgi:hypothetical protein